MKHNLLHVCGVWEKLAIFHKEENGNKILSLRYTFLWYLSPLVLYVPLFLFNFLFFFPNYVKDYLLVIIAFHFIAFSTNYQWTSSQIQYQLPNQTPLTIVFIKTGRIKFNSYNASLQSLRPHNYICEIWVLVSCQLLG